jgi:hypothetical protein
MPLSTAEDDIMQLVTSLSQSTSGVCEIPSTDKKMYASQTPQLAQAVCRQERSPPLTPESNCSSAVSDPSIPEEGMTASVSPRNFLGKKYAPAPGSLPKDIKLPQRKGGMQLWQFLYAVLQEGHTEIIRYTDDESGLEFRIVDPDTIAAWWGYQKNHKNMNFDKFSRSLRYYYERKLIQRVYGEKFVYRFCCHPEYLYDVLDSSDCRPKLKPLTCVGKPTGSVFQKGKCLNTDLPDWEDIKPSTTGALSPSPGIQQAYSPLSVSPRSISPLPPARPPQFVSPSREGLSPYWNTFSNSPYTTTHPSVWNSAPPMPYLSVPPGCQQPSAFYGGYNPASVSTYQTIQVNSECSLTVPCPMTYASNPCDTFYTTAQPEQRTTGSVSTISSPGLETTDSSSALYNMPTTSDVSSVMPSSASFTSAQCTSYYSQPLPSTAGSISTASSPTNEVVDTNVFSPFEPPSHQTATTLAYPSSNFYHFNEKM